MSLYQRAFARLLALGDDAQHRIYGAAKRRLLGGLAGTVVEIGPGTGLNLAYLPRGVRYVGLEPNPHFHARIRAAARRHGHDAEVHGAPAEASGLPAGCADAVVSTLVLCSVGDPAAVLRAVRRLLRPGGRFVFIEHVAAPAGTWGCTCQRLVRPAWRALADDCRPDRRTGATIAAAGFARVTMERRRLPVPVIAPHVLGTATV